VLELWSLSGFTRKIEKINLEAKMSNQPFGDIKPGDKIVISGFGGESTHTVKFGDNIKVEPQGGGCFIATAAYGTPFAQEINVLRHWRDASLKPNYLGNLFVRFYYKVSPPIAKVVAKHSFLRKLVRISLAPIVNILREKKNKT
jgi:hypothetical protein